MPTLPTEAPDTPTSAASRYQSLTTHRELYLERGRSAAELTLPSVLPRNRNDTGAPTELPTPWQSAGADAVNSLAAKLVLVLMPPGSSFFKLSLSDFAVRELTDSVGTGADLEDARGELEAALGSVERTVISHLESTGLRTSLFDLIRKLLIVGNAMVEIRKDGTVRVFSLEQYVVRRGPDGKLVEGIIQEFLHKSELTPELQQALADVRALDVPTDPYSARSAKDGTVPLYTVIKRTAPDEYRITQEVGSGVSVPDSERTVKADLLPFLALRLIRVDGEHYGYGRVDEYLGDLQSMDSLSQTLIEGLAQAAQVRWMQAPEALTTEEQFVSSPNGSVLPGRSSDFTAVQMNKNADLGAAANGVATIEARLRRAFLVTEPRQAERVTAEEIRVMADELEKALGGIYANLTQELQLPLVRVQLKFLVDANKLPSLPDEAVNPQITTGLEALGRNADLQKLDLFLRGLQGILPDQLVAQYISIGAYLKRRATALQLDVSTLIRSDKEVQEQQAQQQQAAMAQQLTPELIRATAQQGGQQGNPPG